MGDRILAVTPKVLILALDVLFILATVTRSPVTGDSLRLLAVTTGVVSILCALRAPHLAAFSCWISYALMAMEPECRNVVSVFGALIIVWVIAYRGFGATSILSVVGLSYLGSIEPTDGEWIPPAEISSILVFVFFGISAVAGKALKKYVDRQSRKQSELTALLDRERRATTKTLHDAVASTITSIVLRSEVLAIDPEIGPEQRSAVKEIAQDGREAMEEVSALLRHLSSPLKRAPSREPIDSLYYQLSSFIGFISSHGFVVERRPNINNLSAMYCSYEIHYVLRELGTNIIKYAEPKSFVHLAAEAGKDVVTISICNRIALQQSPSFETTHLGIEGMEETLKSLGGEFKYGYEQNVWTTFMTIPVWK